MAQQHETNDEFQHEPGHFDEQKANNRWPMFRVINFGSGFLLCRKIGMKNSRRRWKIMREFIMTDNIMLPRQGQIDPSISSIRQWYSDWRSWEEPQIPARASRASRAYANRALWERTTQPPVLVVPTMCLLWTGTNTMIPKIPITTHRKGSSTVLSRFVVKP